MNYIALIHKEENSDYGVSFPDFPACISAGKTLEEAKLMVQEALISHINLLKEMHEHIPAPMTLEEIMTCPENRYVLKLAPQGHYECGSVSGRTRPLLNELSQGHEG